MGPFCEMNGSCSKLFQINPGRAAVLAAPVCRGQRMIPRPDHHHQAVAVKRLIDQGRIRIALVVDDEIQLPARQQPEHLVRGLLAGGHLNSRVRARKLLRAGGQKIQGPTGMDSESHRAGGALAQVPQLRQRS